MSPHVESRMLLWCLEGAGLVTINQAEFILGADDWILMPWGHRAQYEADRTRPFLVGGIHLIPNHRAGIPVNFRVAHRACEPLAGASFRGDADLRGLTEIVCGRSSGTDCLRLLANYIVEAFSRRLPQETPMRALARLLILELQAAAMAGPRTSVMPAPLRRMQEYVRGHLAGLAPVSSLARLAGVSPATARRLFRKHAGQNPREWIAQTRLQHAQYLLRTTNFTVNSIAREVGFEDPYHFSRFFRKRANVAPREYRRQSKVL